MNDTHDGRGLDDTVEMPAVTADDDDLMTTYAVAMLFKVTSVQVTRWTQRTDPPLHPVITDDGKKRYRRSEVMALHASGFRGETSQEWRKSQERPAVHGMHGPVDSETPEPLPFPDMPDSPLSGRGFLVTSHRRPKPKKQRKAPKLHLPSITLPSFYTLLGCTESGRIFGFKTGWYMVRPEPTPFDEWAES